MSFGALNSAINHGFGPFSQYTAKVIGNDWAWLTACLLAALPMPTWRSATKSGLLFVWPAVIAYYVSDSLRGTYATEIGGAQVFDVAGVVMDALLYVVFGSLLAASVGLVVKLFHRGGVLGILSLLSVPAFIAYRAIETRGWMLQDDAPDDHALLLVSEWIGGTAILTMALIVLGAAFRWIVGTRKRASEMNA
ncbi:hypothetical protein Kisp01_70330 [Kineosporia sp. NBRC 101677]|uniref:hypothetical protein n=1 Tax=Kineosporia sp. NBRC 101677 TaxID=3032197 RepID=UPI0024A100D5|nr:hypothetical protein [Kineosporia sp. NBRC 101677]GLY20019.1 hypothetical protein Kisp01_70330 [Kineosporia sp. NBRC 101677]